MLLHPLTPQADNLAVMCSQAQPENLVLRRRPLPFTHKLCWSAALLHSASSRDAVATLCAAALWHARLLICVACVGVTRAGCAVYWVATDQVSGTAEMHRVQRPKGACTLRCDVGKVRGSLPT
jgi:hypothetical protein